MAASRPDFFQRLGTDTTALIVSFLHNIDRKRFGSRSLTCYLAEKAAPFPLDQEQVLRKEFLKKLKALALHPKIQNITVRASIGRILKPIRFLSAEEIQENLEKIKTFHKEIKGFDRDALEIKHLLAMISEPLKIYLDTYLHDFRHAPSFPVPETIILCIELDNMNREKFEGEIRSSLLALQKIISILFKRTVKSLAPESPEAENNKFILTQLFLLFRRVGLVGEINPFNNPFVISKLFYTLLERNIFDFVENFLEFGIADLEHYKILMRKNASSVFKLMFTTIPTTIEKQELFWEGLRHGAMETLNVFIQLLKKRQSPLPLPIHEIAYLEASVFLRLLEITGNFDPPITIRVNCLLKLNKNNLLASLVCFLRQEIEDNHHFHSLTTLVENIRLTLEHGADVSQKDTSGKTLLDFLKEIEHHPSLSEGFLFLRKRSHIGEEYDKAVNLLTEAMEKEPVLEPESAALTNDTPSAAPGTNSSYLTSPFSRFKL